MRTPATLRDALDTLASEPGSWKPFAGGTDLMVLLESGALPRGRYLSLWAIDELRGISADDHGITIGALTTYTDVLRSPALQREYALLCHAAAETGSIATQNRGTIGGNIANASPAADTPPALLVYDAELEIASARGTRRVPYDRFHTGYKKMDLAADEIITRVHLPRRAAGWRDGYRKVGTRRAQAIAKVCFAGAARLDGDRIADIRIAFGSVAPTVVRARAAEGAVRGRRADEPAIATAVQALSTDIAPIDDIRSTRDYRLRVAGNLLRDYLRSLAG
jgi:CO/xanthine dehydrogenase FAD-binding subunit